jgi:hypothetical protein
MTPKQDGASAGPTAEDEIHTGFQDGYYWLTSTESYIGTVLQLCPEIVLNRYVAVTCIDGGALQLDASMRAAGWNVHAGVGYSPIIHSINILPYQIDGPDGPGYDEWYIFDKPTELGERCVGNIFSPELAPAPGRTAVFVTWGSFVLHRSDVGSQSLSALFWEQFKRISPESYLADGAFCLTFVSRSSVFFDKVLRHLRSAL